MKVKHWTLSSIINAQRADKRDDLAYARRRLAEARALKPESFDPRVAAILTAVKRAGLEVEYQPDLSTDWDRRTHFSIDVQVDGLKDPTFVGLLATVDALVPAEKTSDYASEWMASRTFEFRDDRMVVRICARIKHDSATCHRVKVGTELREVDKYAIVCD